MTNLGTLSDAELQALYNQPVPQASADSSGGLGGMPDEQLQRLYQSQGGPAPAPSMEYTGQIAPFSIDASGKAHFDMNAGIPGMVKNLAERAWSAASAPADVFEGKTQINDPRLLDRATDFATFFGPASVASRPSRFVSQIESQGVPSAQELKAAASAGYDAARNSGLEITGDSVAGMAQALQASLQADHGVIAKTAPKTFAILDELANPPQGGVATVAGIDAARRGLSNITLEGGTEGFAARDAVKRLDDFLGSLGQKDVVAGTASPEAVAQTLRDARGNYAAAMRSNAVTGDLDKATTGILERAENRAHASHSGQNLDNAIRQRVASFLQNPDNVAGYSQPEIDALNAVVKGGPVQNASRFIGNKLGGGGGLGSLASMAFGGAAGSHFMGPEGAAIGAMLGPAIGYSAKGLENSLAKRSLNSADEIIRMNSPLANALANEGILSQPAVGRNSAILRSVLPGLLAPITPQPQPQPSQRDSLAWYLAGGA